MLSETDLKPAVEKAARGEVDAAVGMLAAALVTVVSGHPVAGAIAGAGAEKLARGAMNNATRRLQAADREYDDQCAWAQALQQMLAATLNHSLSALQGALEARMDERQLQLTRFIDRSIGSVGELAEFRQLLTELLDGATANPEPDVRRRYEGPGRTSATLVPHFAAHEELAELAAALANEPDVPVTILDGMGGAGKTTLARQFVAQHGSSLFADGVVWLDATTLNFNLPRAARLYGWARDKEPTTQEAIDWLSHELSTRRVLLVLDDVGGKNASSDILVPGGTSHVLITTRDSNLADRLHVVTRCRRLGRWSENRCRAYLRAAQPAFSRESDVLLNELANHVGGLPLALRLICSHPALDRGLSAEELLNRLRATPLETLERFAKPEFAATRGVVQTFKAAVDGCTVVQRRVLLALSSCAPSARLRTVASVASLSEHSVGEALNRLADVSLVDSLVDGAWGLHDVVRFFARSFPHAGFDAAHIAWIRSHALARENPVEHETFALCVPELLFALTRLLDECNAAAASDLFELAFDHLMRAGAYSAVVDYCERIVQHLPPDSLRMACRLGNLGWCYGELGEYDRSIRATERALAIFKLNGSTRGEAVLLNNLGTCHHNRGQDGEAIARLEQALVLARQIGDVETEANSLGNLGLCHSDLGDSAAAMRFLEEALVLNRRMGRKDLEANQLDNIGNRHLDSGNPSAALRYFEEALALRRETGGAVGEATALLHTARCQSLLGNAPEAILQAEAALAIMKTVGYSRGTVRALIDVMDICLPHDPARVADYCKQLFEEALANGDEGAQGVALTNLGRCYRRIGDLETARQCHAHALELASAAADLREQAISLEGLALCDELEKNYPKAVDSMSRALELSRSASHDEGVACQTGHLGRLHASLGDRERAREMFATSLDMFRAMGFSDTSGRVQEVLKQLAAIPPQAPSEA